MCSASGPSWGQAQQSTWKYLILQYQKKGGDSVNGEVIAGGDEFLLNISLINVDVSYVISATKIEPITF